MMWAIYMYPVHDIVYNVMTLYRQYRTVYTGPILTNNAAGCDLPAHFAH